MVGDDADSPTAVRRVCSHHTREITHTHTQPFRPTATNAPPSEKYRTEAMRVYVAALTFETQHRRTNFAPQKKTPRQR